MGAERRGGRMGLLEEIREGAVDSTTDITTVLRKCLILAEKLGHQGFRSWVEQELNGYGSEDGLPPYRILHVQSRGHFFGPFGSQIRNQPLPIAPVPEEFRKIVTTLPVLDGIGSLASLILERKHGELEAPWPPDLTAFLAHKFSDGMVLAQASRVVPLSLMVGIIETVRNRILSFILEIEKQNPRAGDVELGARPISEERVTQIFTTYIMGSATNVALGSSRFSQTAYQVQARDLNSLRQYLAGLGIGTEDLNELQGALEEDGPPRDPRRIGERVSAWIGKMTGKAVSGVWNVATSAAADVLAAAIRAYYGLTG